MNLEHVREYVEAYGAVAVGLGTTMDNTGVPIFFVVGMGLAYSLEVPAQAMLVAALLGSVAGDLVVFAIGKYFLTRDRLLAGTIGSYCKPVLLAGDRAMLRWGILAIVLGRFVPYIGKIIPFLAGSYNISWPRALVSISVGSMLLIGFFYFFGNAAYSILQGNASVVKTGSLVICTAVLALLYWQNHRLKQRDGERKPPRSRYR